MGRASFSDIAPPSKVLAIGLNYADHAGEQSVEPPKAPLIFVKTNNSICFDGDPIRWAAADSSQVDYEAELAVVIGRTARRVTAARAWDYILGLTCLNDVTARDLQTKDVQYTRAKGFDTFAPMGPCITTGLNREPRAVEGWVNGERRQASNTGQLIFSIEALVEFITFVMTLEPGDVISTGTPSGVGSLAAGDVVTVKVDGIGELSNPVADDRESKI